MNEPFLHPLFDPKSLYRLASQEVIWHDHGEESIKQHFLELYRQRLEREFTPEKPQDWRYSEHVNALIHSVLSQSRDAEREADAPRPSELVDGPTENVEALETTIAASKAKTPALLVYDLQKPVVKPPLKSRKDNPTAPGGSFTGCGRVSDDTPLKSVFKLLGPEQEADVRCLALVFTFELVRELAKVLGLAPDWKDEDEAAIETITAALDPASLTSSDDPDKLRRACRLASLLSLAPGLEGRAEGGRFTQQVNLECNCPTLPGLTWVALCRGPHSPVQES